MALRRGNQGSSKASVIKERYIDGKRYDLTEIGNEYL